MDNAPSRRQSRFALHTAWQHLGVSGKPRGQYAHNMPACDQPYQPQCMPNTSATAAAAPEDPQGLYRPACAAPNTAACVTTGRGSPHVLHTNTLQTAEKALKQHTSLYPNNHLPTGTRQYPTVVGLDESRQNRASEFDARPKLSRPLQVRKPRRVEGLPSSISSHRRLRLTRTWAPTASLYHAG